MNKVALGVVVLIVVAALALVVIPKQNNYSTEVVFCSPDGTLTDTMPIQSHRSYCIKSNLSTLNPQPNTPVTLSFSIVDDEGNTLKDFEIMHDTLLHLIVVRTDLNSFQHLHPELNTATGQFSLSNLTFPSSGPYRVFADFTPLNSQIRAGGIPLGITISEDVTVAGTYTAQSIGTT